MYTDSTTWTLASSIGTALDGGLTSQPPSVVAITCSDLYAPPVPALIELVILLQVDVDNAVVGRIKLSLT
jgi:hypothetical protein